MPCLQNHKILNITPVSWYASYCKFLANTQACYSSYRSVIPSPISFLSHIKACHVSEKQERLKWRLWCGGKLTVTECWHRRLLQWTLNISSWKKRFPASHQTFFFHWLKTAIHLLKGWNYIDCHASLCDWALTINIITNFNKRIHINLFCLVASTVKAAVKLINTHHRGMNIHKD